MSFVLGAIFSPLGVSTTSQLFLFVVQGASAIRAITCFGSITMATQIKIKTIMSAVGPDEALKLVREEIDKTLSDLLKRLSLARSRLSDLNDDFNGKKVLSGVHCCHLLMKVRKDCEAVVDHAKDGMEKEFRREHYLAHVVDCRKLLRSRSRSHPNGKVSYNIILLSLFARH
jgi:hypothetical protein